MNRVFGCKTTQRKFTKKVDDDEETMSVEDAVPCDQRTIGVVDSGGTGKRRARLKIPNGRKNRRVGEKRADEAKTGQKRRGKTQTRAAGPQKTITRFTGPPPQASECLLRLKKKAVENTWCLYVIYIRYASKKWKYVHHTIPQDNIGFKFALGLTLASTCICTFPAYLHIHSNRIWNCCRLCVISMIRLCRFTVHVPCKYRRNCRVND